MSRVSLIFSSVCLAALLVLITSCGGGSMTSTPPPTSTPAQLSVQKSGSGAGMITSAPAGISCGSSCSGSFSANTTLTLTATPSAGSSFAGWSGACTGTGSCKLTLNGDMTVTATFTTEPMLTVTLAGNGMGAVASSPNGITCGVTCSAPFAPGTKVTLTATPATGSVFSGWTGACTGTTTCSVTLTTNTSLAATFSIVTEALTVTSGGGTGTGTITSSPAGINCGLTCTANFTQGTQVTLSETPTAGSTFGGWSGACSGTGGCAVTMNGPVNVSAAFTSGTPTLTVSLSGTGTVTSMPAGISCPSTCSASFPAGTQVTLTATPGTGYFFAGWSLACTAHAPCVVTMNAGVNVGATFSPGTGISQINHVIVLAQENRSFDHYFGEMRQYWADNGYPDQQFDGLPQFNPQPGAVPTNPGCNPADPFQPPGPGAIFQDCVFDESAPVTGYHLITQCVENPSPSWNESHVDWSYYDPTDLNNDFLGNGYVWNAGHDSRNEYFYDNIIQYDTNGVRTMGYYDGGNPSNPQDPGDLNYYYYMATQFSTSDRWFSPVMTRTELNRDFLIGATSGGYAYPEGSNPNNMQQINSPVIYELMQNAGLTWRIYVNPAGTPCEANPTPQCYYDNISYVHTFVYGQTIINDYPQNIVPISQLTTDIQNGTLPALAWIEPASAAGLDEHPADYDATPPCCSVQAGANYVSGIINSLLTSKSWADTALFFTYDEFGGFYDHVAPQPMPAPDPNNPYPVDLLPGDVCTKVTGPLCTFGWTGYRVPMIVISPYANKNFVSHTVADSTAILKFLETRFGLPSMTARDAAQIDMTEFFNFNNPPWVTPPGPPPQNRGGQCYLNSLP